MTLPATDISFADIRNAIGGTGPMSLDDRNVRRLNSKPHIQGRVYTDLWDKQFGVGLTIGRQNSLGEYRNVLCTANIDKEPAENLDATPRKDRVQLIKYDPRGILEWLHYVNRYDQAGIHVDGVVVKVKNNYSLDCGGSLAINSYAEPGTYEFRARCGSQSGTDQRYMIDIYGWTNGWRAGGSKTYLSDNMKKNGNIHDIVIEEAYPWVTVNLGCYVRNQTNASNGSWYVDEVDDEVLAYPSSVGIWECLHFFRKS